MMASAAPGQAARTPAVRRYEAQCELPAPPDAVFARLDDQERLAAHMTKASPMMGGGRMAYAFDQDGGRAGGSHMRWNMMEVTLKTEDRFALRVTRCRYHELTTSLGVPELTPVVCQIDNAAFNAYLPDEVTFTRRGRGRRISDGAPACDFVWQRLERVAEAERPAGFLA